MPFETGDEVEIVSGEYFYTTIGSKGIIKSINKARKTASVSFYYLSSNTYGRELTREHPREWDITIEDLKLINEPSNIDRNNPYYKVLRKIEQLQRKRKDKGYAF